MTVFDFLSYKEFLQRSIERRSAVERGLKLKIAKFLGIHPGYLSKVLNGSSDFSLEQAISIGEFFGLTPAESRFFLLLVSQNRAGTETLRNHFHAEIVLILKQRDELASRVTRSRQLTETDQSRYYSSWIFAAVHVSASVGKYHEPEALAQALGISLTTVQETLEFLVQVGVLTPKNAWYEQGEKSLFLGKDSKFITQHHMNWRLKAIQSLDHINPADFHYSGIITCSAKHIGQIRQALINVVEDIRSQVNASGDEEMLVYNIDLFKFAQ